jgi:hypothetical protein
MQTPGKSCRGNADSRLLRCLTSEYTRHAGRMLALACSAILCLTMALPAPKSDTPSPNL